MSMAEASSELGQSLLQAVDQPLLELALVGWLGDVEEVEDIGIACELLSEFRICRSKQGSEVRRCCALTLV
ncbi:hypothetical protein ACFV9C_42830 [Kribbella sp. NPDC059898]|uniref:hypothetical protein n=1 Tax=Kribbella sp. NPDC059898 TaxID=3346995 RepID=UPI003668A578